ncbi:MAG: hypothetical protein JXN10_03910 [Clostridia bacterium]|nr:hypothetical protein [Clostridia bacterium]MBN2882648.1 hypothetical protein [Clostridia bacterium]
MKKAAVITVSAILFVVLLAVNYLLWDNSTKQESIKELESKEETKQESLEQVLNDYWNEKNLNTDLQQQITDLQNTIIEKDSEITKLTTEKMDIWAMVGDKNNIISQLKKNTDPSIYRAIVEDWVDNIINNDYFMAYSSHNEKDIFNNRADILFTRYGEKFMNIEFMEVTEFKVRLLEGEDALDQAARNRIVFDVLLNVELIKDTEGYPVSDAIFKNGINHFKITMAFDQSRGQWIIWTIE